MKFCNKFKNPDTVFARPNLDRQELGFQLLKKQMGSCEKNKI